MKKVFIFLLFIILQSCSSNTTQDSNNTEQNIGNRIEYLENKQILIGDEIVFQGTQKEHEEFEKYNKIKLGFLIHAGINFDEIKHIKQENNKSLFLKYGKDYTFNEKIPMEKLQELKNIDRKGYEHYFKKIDEFKNYKQKILNNTIIFSKGGKKSKIDLLGKQVTELDLNDKFINYHLENYDIIKIQ